MSTAMLLDLPRQHRAGERVGIVSICSAHPLVVESALLAGRENRHAVLIEATCNQVNQDGGYTGMTPLDFRQFVEAIAAKVGFDTGKLILGGDHLGPNPWKHLPADEAMEKSRVMIAAFAAAGFTKLHLDTSMGCAAEPVALPDDVTAERAAFLAQAAESALPAGGEKPVYIIGTEVPVPGGALEALDHLQVTKPAAALDTIEVHRRAFAARGLSDPFSRVVGVVVQPGVEFGNEDVVVYEPAKARALSDVLQQAPQFVFEAHSTDYQPETALSALVADGFSILKVGPALTFALREAIYGLDQVAVALGVLSPRQTVALAMEELMLREPQHWQKYYHGGDAALRVQRHFSYSDRIRYYWPHPDAVSAVNRLMAALGSSTIPMPLISQFLGNLHSAVAIDGHATDARSLLLLAIRQQIDLYARSARTLAHGNS
ncbi:D-tagatose-bisphosphate aldolase, class II, non-catalytic subunit [Devosia lacusdianchii]|uniref:D-tagatose-bisphosphate aldolase, class II, non-catalytic subunit n=1 Tax=Devosia lacusdianchii TaxID=2917991 RepID=UPI001F068A4E|nr:D-tagatose-bisphosphate aldolase, class II, non-catalytic subunit [Devosia sp. JXJ CY 41]